MKFFIEDMTDCPKARFIREEEQGILVEVEYCPEMEVFERELVCIEKCPFRLDTDSLIWKSLKEK